LHPSGTVRQFQHAFQLVHFYGELKNEGWVETLLTAPRCNSRCEALS
jgi:hypothetical protein